jgi:hypothetical protein
LEQLKQKFPFDRGWDERWYHYLEVQPAPPRWSLNDSSMDSLLEVPGFGIPKSSKSFSTEKFWGGDLGRIGHMGLLGFYSGLFF